MIDEVELLKKENEQLKTQINEYKTSVIFLEDKVAYYEQKFFGKKSEKLHKDDTPDLFNEIESVDKDSQIEEEEVPETVTVPSHQRSKPKGKRKPISDKLPRVEITHDIPDEEKVCACGCEMAQIGSDISEKIVFTPAKLEVERHIRPKYACKSCEGIESEGVHQAVKIAPMPPAILPKSIATESLFTQIITSKFVDGLPFYRQEKIFNRLGIDIPRETMCRWSVKVYEQLKPVMDILHKELLKSRYIGIDETRVQVLNEPGKKAEALSWMWVYRGVTDDGKVMLIYQYDESRSGKIPDEYLKEYKGKIQTDGYSGYNRLAQSPDIIRYGCWAHVRRKFMESVEKSGDHGLAREFLDLIGTLYGIEKELRENKASPSRVEFVRLNRSLPVIRQIQTLAKESVSTVLPKSYLGNAINHMIKEWENLERYLYDGHITIDNNLVENAIRPFVIGRKNWLFFDSQAGVTASSGYYSLIETAKANGLEPWSYLIWLFKRLPLCKTYEEYFALIPSNADKKEVKEYTMPR